MYSKYHRALWRAVNCVAERCGHSCSGFALRCGLDATAFNNSKRQSRYGQPRWLSSETIAKILIASGLTLAQFAEIFERCLENMDLE